MMTTDNSQPISEDEANHVDNPDNDNGKTQTQINREELVQAEVSAPVSESQVQPGREAVDGNGQRDLDPVEGIRPDIIVNPDAVTQSKVDALDAQKEHGQRVQDEQNAKLNQNTKPGTDASDE